LRIIRNITDENYEKNIKNIQLELTIKDLEIMIKNADKIENLKQTIILAEEFI
jgi:hypothetical protein